MNTYRQSNVGYPYISEKNKGTYKEEEPKRYKIEKWKKSDKKKKKK